MADVSSRQSRVMRWYLESTVDGGKSLERMPILSLPFRIGRLEGLDLTLPFDSVSKRHAEIFEEGDELVLRDLESTNGTFVNRKRVSGALLREGDILHFADLEFRLRRQPVDRPVDDDQARERGTLAIGRLELPQQFPGGTRELSELLDNGLVSAEFQPIVTLPAGEVIAYEALGRGEHPELPRYPVELFRIAETMEREAELSRLFRRRAVERAVEANAELPRIFLNTHPSELGRPELLESLEALRELSSELPLALEIHERALADPQVIRELKHHLEELDIRLALDDFGLGERILELAEVPPDYLKFDMRFVKGIDRAQPSKRRLLAMLIAAAREVDAKPIAEGIETDREAEVSATVGFALAQGYLFSEPLPLEELMGRPSSQEPSDEAQNQHQRNG